MTLNQQEIQDIVEDGLSTLKVDGKRVVLIVPDATRTCPIDVVFPMLHQGLAGRVAALDVLIALGTHQPMSVDAIYARMGIDAELHATQYQGMRFFNHAWDDPEALMEVGAISKEEIHELTGGLFEIDVPVTCNKMLADYELAIILGPVFPHEVAGFSGGNKYLFPGVSGPDVLHVFHWLGALITNHEIIGSKWTPVRKVIDAAAGMVPLDKRAFCMVVADGELDGMYFGTPEDSWSQAADHSARLRSATRMWLPSSSLCAS